MSVDFVHLHVHSDYSMLDGACQVKRLCEKVADQGGKAIAVTDHGNMFSTMDLYWAADKAGVKPIIGCEFYVTPSGIADRTDKRRYHLVILAKDYEGYQTMCRLNALAWSEEGFYYKPRIDREALRKYHKNVIGLSACIGGEIAQNILKGNREGAIEALNFYIDIFGRDDFYLEIQDHGMDEEKLVNAELLKLSQEFGVELVCTNDAHYLAKEHAPSHDALLCIGTQAQIEDVKRMRFPNDEFYLKTGEEMAELFKEFPRAVENTVKIADKCNIKLDLESLHYPVYRLEFAREMAKNDTAPAIPEQADDESNPNCPIRRNYLLDICKRGLAKRYKLYECDNPDYVRKSEEEPDPEFRQEILDRMNFEMGIIDRMGFISYFLVVWDFINYARSIDIPVGPGRGSGAGSLVAYLTGITDLDPLLYGLLFERFLNPDRVSPPDFDIDFCERRRSEVIEYVRHKYGHDRVAQIGTYGTLKAKAVLKDVARVKGIPFADVNKVVGAIPTDPKMTLEKAKEIPEIQQFIQTQAWVQDLFEMAEVLEGLNRNQSIHACGVIIGDQPLADVVPLSRGAGKEVITQFPAYPCEAIGLLKMDFLGLKTLTIIQDTIEMFNTRDGSDFTPDDISLYDDKTYKLLNKGDTIGVFQLESGGMQDLCRRFGISKIEEIIALVALYRPGPMQFIDTYIDCKLGKQQPDYETKEMEELLSETYGIMVYQEQIMQVVQAVAGFSLAQADIMRRAIGKKKEAVLVEQGKLFTAGCLKMGHTEKIAASIWEKILKFASYGFNKSHSACYGLMSYRTAYLKANYPSEFMAAILNAEINNAEKLSFYIAECKEMGLKILAPDVNSSGQKFTVNEGNILFGIAGLKGVGSNAASAIMESRKQDGPYTDLLDFCERVGSSVNKRVVENLCRAGGFDCFGLHRSQIFEVIEQALALASSTAKDKAAGQGSLFDFFGGDSEEEMDNGMGLQIPNVPEWSEKQLLAFEKELLGFYVSGHPLGEYAKVIQTYATTSIARIKEAGVDETGVLVGGMITTLDIRQTRRTGESMAILTLEDLDSNIECLIFPKAYKECGVQLQTDAVIFIEAFISNKEDKQCQLIAEKVHHIDEVAPHFTSEVHIRVNEANSSPDDLHTLKSLLQKFPGKVPVVFCITCGNGEIGFVRASQMHGINLCKELIQEVKNLLGEKDTIHIKASKKTPERKNRSWKKFEGKKTN